MLDQQQLITGLSVLLAFFVGYRYGLKIARGKDTDDDSPAELSSSSTKQKVYSDRGEYKLVLVVRNDLKMGKGKIGAQCGHGAVGAYQRGLIENPQAIRRWENSGSAKIAVKVNSEQEIIGLKRMAAKRNLTYCIIQDAGRTQIAAGSTTVLAIGPARAEEIDEVTGHLKLL